MKPVLSICTGMGLLDRAFLDTGFDVVPGCEIDPDMRQMYAQVCGGEALTTDIKELEPERGAYRGMIGGPPCQARTRLRAMRTPKFPDLGHEVCRLVELVRPDWYLFENVAPIEVPGSLHVRLNAMHFGKPHQSRARWFTYSPNLVAPAPLYRGTVDDLLAYSVVAGRIYGRRRAAVLQGWPQGAEIKAAPLVVVKGLVNAVHYGTGKAWAESVRGYEDGSRRVRTLFA